MEFVVNEWLPDYLRADSDKNHNLLAIQFLKKFFKSEDKLIVKIPSPFADKVYRYEKRYSGYPIVSDNYRRLSDMVFRNSSKTKLIYTAEVIAIPDSTFQRLHTQGTNFQSDLYLFESANCCESRLIITTDGRLKDFMKDDPHFKIQLLEDFLPQY